MRRNLILAVLCLTVVCMVGCEQGQRAESMYPVGEPGVMKAQFTKQAVTVDGILNEPVWKQAEIYHMTLADDRRVGDVVLKERCNVRLAWDDNYFYISAWFEDSDIIAEGGEDQMDHYALGDVCEIFIKPVNQTWYWELFATPRVKKTSKLWPERGELKVADDEKPALEMQVGAYVIGTVNDVSDTDKGWGLEVALSIDDLSAMGEDFRPGGEWLVLVARQNYFECLECPGKELSMTPKLTETNYHLYEEYASLKFVK